MTNKTSEIIDSLVEGANIVKPNFLTTVSNDGEPIVCFSMAFELNSRGIRDKTLDAIHKIVNGPTSVGPYESMLGEVLDYYVPAFLGSLHFASGKNIFSDLKESIELTCTNLLQAFDLHKKLDLDAIIDPEFHKKNPIFNVVLAILVIGSSYESIDEFVDEEGRILSTINKISLHIPTTVVLPDENGNPKEINTDDYFKENPKND